MNSVNLRSSSIDLISHSIPQEIQMHILSYLGVKDLCKMVGLSRRWQGVASDDSLWSRFWDRYHVTPTNGTEPKKALLQQCLTEKVAQWECFFQGACNSHFSDRLKEIEKHCILKRYEQIQKQAPVFLKEILRMKGPENDAIRADFFFEYLDQQLPIIPLISDVDFLVDLEWKRNAPIYFKTLAAILNIRNGNIDPLFKCCDELVENNRQCMHWMPFPRNLQQYLIDMINCDKHVVFIRLFTESIFYSKGASYSELFRCREFNPNVLIPPWIDFLDFPRKHLGAITKNRCPFIFVFILQFFTLPMTSESYVMSFNATSSRERNFHIKFDPDKYVSLNLPCAITPQEIALEQLFEDLKVLVQRGDIDLGLTGANGLTTLQLLKEMRDSYFAEAGGVLGKDLYIYDQAISILESAG